MNTNKTYLIILDGVGIAPDGPGNAVSLAQKPFLDALWCDNPMAQLQTHGDVVGLPSFQMGGSEVGHLTIGAGRTIKHILTTINEDLESGAIAKKKELQVVLQKAKKKGRIHLLGLVSDGGIHSFLAHLLALQKLANDEGIEDICIHAITDGRDVGQRSCEKFLEAIEDQGIGKIVTIGGRFYPMDRDTNWERTKKGYDVICDPAVKEDGRNWQEVVRDHYEKTEDSDYYLDPVLLDKSGQMSEEDAVVCFNFRTDRMRQIMSVFCDETFGEFDRPFRMDPDNFAVFGNYYPDAHTVYELKSDSKKNTLGEVISNEGLTQLRVTETEKFNHVTFFFSGNKKEPFKGEDRILIPSAKCASYAEKPEMSAAEQTDAVLEKLEEQDYDFVIQNYANGDMVGHSGDIEAATKAIEVVDECLRRLVPVLLKKGYNVCITADHGNSDEMIYPDGTISSAHSKNLVAFVVLKPDGQKVSLKEKGTLVEVAPTVLDLMRIKKPEEMTGESLIS